MIEGLTETQSRYVEAVREHGSARAAAKALGVHYSGVSRALIRAARKGPVPGNDLPTKVLPGYVLGKVTEYRDGDGNLKGYWPRQEPEAIRQREAIEAALEAMKEEIPRAKPVKAPKNVQSDLCNLYTLTDCHVGMLAHHKEGGADWDLKIAESTLTDCFDRIVDSSPPARVAVVNQLGDWLHSDSLSPVTPTSGHIVDQDGRYGKVVAAAIRILRRIVDRALQSHEEVHLIVAEGNHDLAGSVWLRLMFTALYEREPRVTVCDSELPYYTYQHGKTMLAFHHGHLSKNGSLPLLFAAQYPEMWGATTKRYAHTGHRHHVEIKEHAGMTVCQHSTLAARDAYAARGGWFSERQITSYTYHATHGQVGSCTVVPEMCQ